MGWISIIGFIALAILLFIFARTLFWFLLGILVLCWIIRGIADVFWWGRDEGKW